MDLSRLRPVYEHDGPFSTVYFERRGPGADAGEQIRLRWQQLREVLESAFAALAFTESVIDKQEGG